MRLGRTALASVLAAMGLAAIAGGLPVALAAPERVVLVPPPAMDAVPNASRAVAVLAGGCFWGMEAVFSHVKGVRGVTSGYAGGSAVDANYAAVSSERTRHAEAVRIEYDPRQVSYGTLLRVFFSVAHNPTERNRQGPDTGLSYRSAIFPQDADQARIARAYIVQITRANSWQAPIVTHIEQGRFFPAEAEHQNFAARNPDHGYIRAWDIPKMAALKKTFPALWAQQPSA